MKRIYTEFHNKDFCVENIKNHINTLSLPGNTDSNFLWATKFKDGFDIKALSPKEDVKNILISSSSNANSSIKRILDQIQFECNRKFGGSNVFVEKLIIALSNQFIQNQNQTFPSLLIEEWIKILFEELVPKHLSDKAVPNNLEGFIRASKNLSDVYPLELIQAVLEALLVSGSGGSLMIKQNGYSSGYKVQKGSSGYNFTTFQPSEIFVGLQKYKEQGITFNNPKVMLVNGAIEEISEIEEILEASYESKQPIIFLANRISEEVFECLRMNLDSDNVQCFGAEILNDYISLNTINDVGVVLGLTPISPLTMASEYLMAKWDELGTAQEIIFYRNGKVAIKNELTERAVKEHVKKIAQKRATLDDEQFSLKEPIYTRQIKNLTTNATTLYIPYMTDAQGETIKLQVDSVIRYFKSVISYGCLNLSDLNPMSLVQELKSKVPKQHQKLFEENQWFFEEIVKLWKEDNFPYIYISGASRLVAQQISLLFSTKGIITLVD